MITLSTGGQITLSVSISLPASAVTSVQYTIHAPAQVTVKNVTYPSDDLNGKESVVWLNDAPDQLYHVTVVVRTLPGMVGSLTVTSKVKSFQLAMVGQTNQSVLLIVIPL